MLFNDTHPLRTTCATWALAPLLLLAACSTPPDVPPLQTALTQAAMQTQPAPIPVEPPKPPVASPPLPAPKAPDTTPQVLAWADRTRTLPATELIQEISRITELPDADRSPTAELQLAIALGQTHVASDLPRAQATLQKLLANQTGEARALHPLARLVAARLAEQKRVEDQLEKQNQQIRDQQRRIDQLNERLEAMRAIERSLTTRPNGAAAPLRPLPNP